MKRALPKLTFELLVKKRRLAVMVPETGYRFVISLRDWELCLWAVRIVLHEPRKRQPDAYETAHRLISRERIEAWLERLAPDPKPQRGLKLDLRDYITEEEREHYRWLERQVSAGRLPKSCRRSDPWTKEKPRRKEASTRYPGFRDRRHRDHRPAIGSA